MRLRFGPFELDDERFLLTRDGAAIPLRPKVFDLLHVLVRERARVVRREELFERLWSKTAVGFGSLSGLVNELRGALGENGRSPSSIRTVHARGYQFVAPVIELEVGSGPAPEQAEQAGPAAGGASIPDEPSRVVRPPRPAPDALRVAGLRALRAVLPSTGARALVACLSAEDERAAWRARRAAEAIAAGFVLRSAAASREGRLPAPEVGGEGRAAGDSDARAESIGSIGGLGRARPPIALLLEVDDPPAWHRAGGLRRLLDLLGRSPVLVIAALASRPDEPIAGVLLGEDDRIEWDGAASLPASHALGGGVRPAEADAAALIDALHDLRRAGGAHFLPALRALGFELVGARPIREMRRVEPEGRRADPVPSAEAG